MHLQITFRDKSREPLIVDVVEFDTGQLFWARNGSADYEKGHGDLGQVRFEDVSHIRPFSFYPDNGEGVTE